MTPYEQALDFERKIQSGILWTKPEKVKKPRIKKNTPMVIPKTEIAKALAAVQPETKNFKVFTDPPAFDERRTKFALGVKINAHLKGRYMMPKKEMKRHFLQIEQTPMAVVHSMIHYVGYVKNAKTLVFCNVEFVLYLVKVLGVDVNTIFFVDDCIDMADETGKIASIKAGMLSELVNFPAANIVNQRDLEKLKMKFDFVVGNPPYVGAKALHQQFFVKAFSMLADTGTVAFIQPATMYFNKKDTNRKLPETEMINICQNHAIFVKFIDGEIAFPAAKIKNAVAITVATKQRRATREIDVVYMNNSKMQTIIENMNQLQLPGGIYHAIRSKFEAMCEKNGSFLDVVWSKNIHKAHIAKIRGNAISKHDFYTLVPNKNEDGTMIESHVCGDLEYGIPIGTPDNLDNFYDYCQTDFARMALAILKFNPNSHAGELACVPLVDFSKKYSEDELCDMAGFNEEERKIIMTALPDFHNRRK